MKRAKLLIGMLSLSLTLLISTAFATSTSAGLYCYQLAGCAGQAGCAFFGSASGCSITCSDGTAVACFFIIIEEPCCPRPREPFIPEI